MKEPYRWDYTIRVKTKEGTFEYEKETLEIKEIKSIELEFYKEKYYGLGFDNRELTKIAINKENRNE